MALCPIMSYRHSGMVFNEAPCLKKDCAWAGVNGECLVSQALQCYINQTQDIPSTNEICFKPPATIKIP